VIDPSIYASLANEVPDNALSRRGQAIIYNSSQISDLFACRTEGLPATRWKKKHLRARITRLPGDSCWSLIWRACDIVAE
jgi:hypothetical protein